MAASATLNRCITALKLAMRVKPTTCFKTGSCQVTSPCSKRLAQTTTGRRGLKSKVIEHWFQQCRTTPSGDFCIGKKKLKPHDFAYTEIASFFLTLNYPKLLNQWLVLMVSIRKGGLMKMSVICWKGRSIHQERGNSFLFQSASQF